MKHSWSINVKNWLLVLCGLALSSNALATDCKPVVFVDFIEGAPKDQVVISHDSANRWHLRNFVWSLEGSNGDLIFDTVRGGAGFDVAQPFEDSGTAKLATAPKLADGDRRLSLTFDEFPTTTTYRFTLDVDDRISGIRGTMVNEAEIAGAEISVVMADPNGQELLFTGMFGDKAKAVLSARCGN
jgi:hypothetical protein